MIGINAPSLGDYASGERAVAILAVLAAIAATLVFVRISRGTWGAAMRAVRQVQWGADHDGSLSALLGIERVGVNGTRAIRRKA